ncbi:hypothetical protein B9Z65_5491 [Elsinoe australis]|uniref:Complex III subunit 9 n=1 Tax=Elsinoe australis TaxID=40998 RepID=A0A2P7ZE71_9PEZI|nr:hypothetical protein B9Z65_5491 [Elsinoe australis]
MSSIFGTIYKYENQQHHRVGSMANDRSGLIKRNTVFLGTVFASAFALEIAFDTTSNKIWDAVNRGRQWKDIKYRYLQKAEDEDDDE